MKHIKIPRFIDLGCNDKARVIAMPNGDNILVSYVTPIAIATRNNTVVRSLNDINTNTTWRHWGAFCRFIHRPDLIGADAFRKLERVEYSH